MSLITHRQRISCAPAAAGALVLAAGAGQALGEPLIRADAFEEGASAPQDPGAQRRLALSLQRAALASPLDPALREAAKRAIRQALADGSLSPFRVQMAGVVEEAYGAPAPSGRTSGMNAAQFDGHMERVRSGNPHPWAGQIAYGEDFEYVGYTPHVSLSALADLRPLHGQVAPHGSVWKTSNSRSYNGLLDNTTAQTGVTTDGMGGFNAPGSGYFGVPGGPDPMGDRGQFMASPRGSVYDLTSTAFDTSFQWVARLDHEYFVGTPTQPATTIIDWYMDTLETFTWFRPVASPEGCIATNLFMGGIDFFTFAPFTNDDNVIDRPVWLGAKPGSFNEGEYIVGQHTLKAREWFQVSLRQGVDSMSLWIRDSETLGANPSGMPYDAPGFAGEVYDTGWVQLYPGIEDDPGTPQIEGTGISVNSFGQQATQYVMADGNIAGINICTFGIEELQVVGGFDNSPAFAPGYKPTDWYFDNYSIIGVPFVFAPLQPTSTLPYFDDIELWTPGPLALQGNRWFDAFSFSAIDDTMNHTPGLGLDGGAPSQSVRVVNQFPTYAYGSAYDLQLEDEKLVVRAGPGKDLTHSSWFYLQDHSTTFGLDLTGGFQRVARVHLGGADASGVVDDRLYLRLPNPNYDPALPEQDTQAINTVWDGVGNREFIPTPMVTPTGAPATIPAGQWFQVSVVVNLDPGDVKGDVTVYLDGDPLSIDTDFFTTLGNTPPSAENCAGLILDEISVEIGKEPSGAGSRLWWDDVFVDGLEILRATPLTINSPPYSDQPAHTFPYADDFSSYVPEFSLAGQGAGPFLRSITSGFGNRVDILAPDAPIAPGDDVYTYVVDDVLVGGASLPSEIAPGATVVVADNIPPFADPLSHAIPGATLKQTRARMRNGSGMVVGEFDWTLQAQDAAPWDGVTPVVGRYYFEYFERWTGDEGVAFVADVDAEHPGHGEAVVLTQSFVSTDSATGDLDDALRGYLSGQVARPGESVSLSFDMFIESAGATPSGRTAWDIRDASSFGYDGALHALFVFGGPNIYEDNLENFTLAPNPDGKADNMGPEFASDPSRLYVSVPTATTRSHTLPPSPADFVLADTGFAVPFNTWMRLSFEVETSLQWTMTIQDDVGATLFTTSGASIDHHVAEPTIQGLAVLFGNDDGGAGRAAAEPIVWRSLGEAAAPEGGLDPHTTNFNSIPAEYFYYEINDIEGPPGTVDPPVLPQVSAVDLVTGTVSQIRDLQVNDIVVFQNDTGSGAGAPTGVRHAESHPRNRTWTYSADGGATIHAEGEWTALGLPGRAGANDPLPVGGLANATPPYTPELPYRTLLMGSILEIPPHPAPTPAHRALVDNVLLEMTGCYMDLTGDGSVSGPDLAALLASWGPGESPFDTNADDAIDGVDLAALLSNWGACN